VRALSLSYLSLSRSLALSLSLFSLSLARSFSQGTEGRPREEKEEWDHHKNGIVDKMVQEMEKFKI
jgi:hypothetical protein